MNSKNLSRFHKFPGSNFKKIITEIKFQLRSFLHSSQIQIQKRIQEERKKKFYSKLYTKFLSVPFFLGSEHGSYFTILTLSIYNCQKKLGLNAKTSRWNSQKKAQFTVLGRDLGLMSRHGFPLFALVQSQPCYFCCDQVPCSCFD